MLCLFRFQIPLLHHKGDEGWQRIGCCYIKMGPKAKHIYIPSLECAHQWVTNVFLELNVMCCSCLCLGGRGKGCGSSGTGWENPPLPPGGTPSPLTSPTPPSPTTLWGTSATPSPVSATYVHSSVGELSQVGVFRTKNYDSLLLRLGVMDSPTSEPKKDFSLGCSWAVVLLITLCYQSEGCSSSV